MMRNALTSRSPASSGVVGGRFVRAAGFAIRSRIAVFRLALPILGDGEELIEVSERTREGWRIAIVWATIPPTDWPTNWAVYQPNASSTATASSAMSSKR